MAALPPVVVIASRGGGGLWLGLALGFFGAVLVILSGHALGPSPRIAVLLAVMALLGMTSATLFEKWHGMKTDPVTGGLIQYVTGFLVLMPAAWFSESMTIDWQPGLVVSLAYLVIANSLVSIGLYIALLQRGDATRISALLYLVPPLAMGVAWVLLREPVTPLTLAGFAMSAFGVYLVNRQKT